MKRFIKNEFFVEKNATIVNFPIKNLDLNEFVWSDDLIKEKEIGQNKTNIQTPPIDYKYDLIANIIHEGKPDGGVYKC